MTVAQLIEELRQFPAHMPVRMPAVTITESCDVCHEVGGHNIDGDTSVDGVRHNGGHVLIEAGG